MRQLESDIVDVNTIFKVPFSCQSYLVKSFCGQDLATMVHDQGEIVDSIEQNIESTTVQVWAFFYPSSDLAVSLTIHF